MRWLVGDVQGCARDLEALLQEVRFERGRDELWLLGDLINRGPDSLEVLRIWQDLDGQGVLGNHDIYALQVRAGRWPRKEDTLKELFAAHDADTLLDRLAALPVLAHIDPGPARTGVWAVHAGLHPDWSQDLESAARDLNEGARDGEWFIRGNINFATRARCCLPDGTRSRFHGKPEDCPVPYRPWDEFYWGPELVVHGHWAWRGHYRGLNTLGLDSGNVYGGPLSAWCLEEDRVVQVRPTRR